MNTVYEKDKLPPPKKNVQRTWKQQVLLNVFSPITLVKVKKMDKV
jgi:hypothetical protein